MPRRQVKGNQRGKQQQPKAAEEPKTHSQNLPSKEQTAFKSVLKYYEAKQYKKGIKAADLILKKFPNHGETLAMKGLILNSQEKKEEAYNFVKLGLKNNLTSHVCWHVYGLLHRSDRNYHESIKCYQQALKIDKSNSQILRDLSFLQIQTRSYEGFKETRRTMLTNKPSNRSNWLAFAFAAHVAGDLPLALSVISEYKKTLDKDPKKPFPEKEKRESSNASSNKRAQLQQKLEKQKESQKDDAAKKAEQEKEDLERLDYELFGYLEFEKSETLMYRNLILEESGDLQVALDDLKAIEVDVMDRYSLQEKRALFNLKLGKFKQASDQYKALVLCNGDNYDYHRGLQQSLGFLPATETADATTTRDPKTMGASQARIVRSAGVYTTNTTTNAVPSVSFFDHCGARGVYDKLSEREYGELKALYKELSVSFARVPDAVKRLPLEFLRGEEFVKAFSDYVKPKLRKGVPSLFNSVRSLYEKPEKVKVMEEIILNILSSVEKNNTFPGEEEEGDPCVVLWCCYYLAHHYDHLKQSKVALEYINKAIEHTPTVVDLYLCKGKIYSHGGDPILGAYWSNYARELDLADRYLNVKCTKMLLRADMPELAEDVAVLFTKDGDNTLHDMQAMWYEVDRAEAFRRLGKKNLALKNYAEVLRHFDDIEEDQMDFHGYALRKMTARAYLGMVRMEDSLRSHQSFVRATVGMVEIYLDLHKNPKSNPEDALSPEEKKKLAAKKRKQEAKEAAKAAENKNKKNVKKDEDPEGMKLLEVEKPLEEALKRYRVIEERAHDLAITHFTGFEVYHQMGKVMLMLRCIKRALAIDPAHPNVHKMIVKFFAFVDKKKEGEGLHAHVEKVVEGEREALLKGKKVGEYNEEYLAKAEKLDEIIAALEMKKEIENLDAKALFIALSPKLSSVASAHSSFARAFEFVKTLEGGDEEKKEREEKVKEIGAGVFPYSRVFGSGLAEPEIAMAKNNYSKKEIQQFA